MLGYVVATGRGAADTLMREVAMALRASGLRVAGAVQVNVDIDPSKKCQMDLHILSGESVVRISQDLGALSRGCRLDPNGLEQAVGLVAAGLDAGADLLVVNKFGKQELDGRGFRPLMGEALTRGVPVLTAVNGGNVNGFEAWAEGMATRLPQDAAAVIDWCRAQAAEASAV